MGVRLSSAPIGSPFLLQKKGFKETYFSSLKSSRYLSEKLVTRRALSFILEWRRICVDLTGRAGVLLEVLSIKTLSDSSSRPMLERRLRPGLSTTCARASDVPAGRLELVHLVAARGGALVEVGRCVGRERALLDQSCTCLSGG